MSYRVRFDISLGSTATGLTLKAQVWDDATPPAQVGAGYITTGFSETGLGEYTWDYSSFADGFVGEVRIFDASNILRGKVAVEPGDALVTAPIARDSSGRVTLTPAEHTQMTADMDAAIDGYEADGSTWFGQMYINASDSKTAAESVDGRFTDARAAKIDNLLDNTHVYATAANVADVPQSVWEYAGGRDVDTVGGSPPDVVDPVADVQAGLTAQGYTTGRAPNLDNLAVAPPTAAQILTAFEPRLDGIDSAIADIPAAPSASDVAEATWSYDGRDVQTVGGEEPAEAPTVYPSDLTHIGGVAITTPLPAGRPSGLLQGLQWLIQKSMDSIWDKVAGTLTVKSNDGATLTTQAVVSDETTESVSPPAL